MSTDPTGPLGGACMATSTAPCRAGLGVSVLMLLALASAPARHFATRPQDSRTGAEAGG